MPAIASRYPAHKTEAIMSGDMSARQIIEVWRSWHGVELTPLQLDKLEAAVLLIAEGSYLAGVEQGRKEAGSNGDSAA